MRVKTARKDSHKKDFFLISIVFVFVNIKIYPKLRNKILNRQICLFKIYTKVQPLFRERFGLNKIKKNWRKTPKIASAKKSYTKRIGFPGRCRNISNHKNWKRYYQYVYSQSHENSRCTGNLNKRFSKRNRIIFVFYFYK